MCELLAAMRRVPIDPPGGSGPALGGPSNPSYSVSVSDLEAAGFRNKHHDEVESKRLFTGAKLTATLPEGISSAFQAPVVGLAAATVTGRRASSVNQGRRSGDSLRGPNDLDGNAMLGQATHLQPYRLR